MGTLPTGILKVRLVMTLWTHVDRTPMQDPGEGPGKSQSIKPESSRQGSGQDSGQDSRQGIFQGKEELEHGASI